MTHTLPLLGLRPLCDDVYPYTGNLSNYKLPLTSYKLSTNHRSWTLTSVYRSPQKTCELCILMTSLQEQSSSFQINLSAEVKPLLVFINPKSGGRQGLRCASNIVLPKIYDRILNYCERSFQVVEEVPVFVEPASGLQLASRRPSSRVRIPFQYQKIFYRSLP